MADKLISSRKESIEHAGKRVISVLEKYHFNDEELRFILNGLAESANEAGSEVEKPTATVCSCIKLLAEKGYVQPNLLNPGQYFLYSIMDGRVQKGVPALQLIACPVCGNGLVIEK